MTDSTKPNGLPEGAQHEAPKLRPQNPVFRAMGLPNIRFKLPSRNWMIFLSVTGSFAAAITYDRRQKKANRQKWCDMVAHLAQQPLAVSQLPRKITIFLSAPPGDGIRPSREYFKEYIKPILSAAAMDYDVVEGRKEGEVRYGTAEQIRRRRRKMGEKGSEEETDEPDAEQTLDVLRDKIGLKREPGVGGDLVIGRHTWKEYIRGLHEGWLGPLDEPPKPLSEPSLVDQPVGDALETAQPSDSISSVTSPEAISPPETPSEEKAKEDEKEKEKDKPPSPPYAYISTATYSASPLASTIPQYLEPSAPVPHNHLLGFLRTPIRLYNYLNQRHLADDIGRQTAGLVLASYRPYEQSSSFVSTSTADLDAPPHLATRAPESDANSAAEVVHASQAWEQQAVLSQEEPTWHKSVRKPRKDQPDLERVWLDDVVVDERIATRMRRFEITAEEDERAARIGKGEETGRARVLYDYRSEGVKREDLSHLD